MARLMTSVGLCSKLNIQCVLTSKVRVPRSWRLTRQTWLTDEIENREPRTEGLGPRRGKNVFASGRQASLFVAPSRQPCQLLHRVEAHHTQLPDRAVRYRVWASGRRAEPQCWDSTPVAGGLQYMWPKGSSGLLAAPPNPSTWILPSHCQLRCSSAAHPTDDRTCRHVSLRSNSRSNTPRR